MYVLSALCVPYFYIVSSCCDMGYGILQETKRYVAEIDRLRRLVARRGTGSGQDGISLVTYESDENPPDTHQLPRSARSGTGSTTTSPFNASRNSLFSRRTRSPPSQRQYHSDRHPQSTDFNKTIRTQVDFNSAVRASRDNKGSPASRSVQFRSAPGEGFGGGGREGAFDRARSDSDHDETRLDMDDSLDLSPGRRHDSNHGQSTRAISVSRSHELNTSASSDKGRLRWGSLEQSLAQEVGMFDRVYALF